MIHDLRERVKELNCLYGLSRLGNQPFLSVEGLLREAANLLPPAFRYPQATRARIRLGNREFRSSGFCRSRWCIRAPLLVDGRLSGSVEVFSGAGNLVQSTSPFLPGEQEMLDAYAVQLGITVGHRTAREKALGRVRFSIGDYLDAMAPGEQLVCIYYSDEERRNLIVPFAESGLKQNHRTIIAGNPRDETPAEYFRLSGIEPGPCLEQGQLVLLRAQDVFVDRNAVGPGTLRHFLDEEHSQALAEGYSALRMGIDMTALQPFLQAMPDPLEWNFKSTNRTETVNAILLLQYDGRLLDPAQILGLMVSHPVTAIGSRLYHNPFCLPEGSSGSPIDNRVILEQWLRNLEDRYLTECELLEEEERFRTILGNAPFGYFRVGSNGEIQLVNRSWEQMHGLSADEVVGQHLSLLSGVQAAGETRSIVEKALRGEFQTGEINSFRADGTALYLSFNIHPIRHGDRVTGAECFLMDITYRKKDEIQMAMMNTELSSYSHAVSHDLKGPVAAIRMTASLMSRAIEDDSLAKSEMADELKSLVSLLDRGVQKAEDLIAGLLSSTDSGNPPVQVLRVPVKSIVESVLEEAAPVIKSRGTAVRTSHEFGQIMANPVHIYQLFSNMIRNAIVHNDNPVPAVEITYAGRQADGSHLYRVKDNGSGIPDDELESIFLPFYKRKSEGTGIGLATAYKITGNYGGWIRASNQDGACFEFALFDYWPAAERIPNGSEDPGRAQESTGR